jgi:uncharacterized protein (DUF58 family)
MADALWLVILAVLDGWGLWSGHGLLTLASSMGLLIFGSLVFTHRFALAGVRSQLRFPTDRANFDDVIDFSLELMNLKPLPVTWLQVRTRLPRNLVIDGGRIQSNRSDFSPELTIVLAMLPYERVVRRLRLRCTRRGEHQFGPTNLESGDYFGMLTAYGVERQQEQILVFPKVFPLTLGPVMSRMLLGRDAARRLSLPDSMRVIGARRY